MFLLDTDVFSITSPTLGYATTDAERWRTFVNANSESLHFGVVTLMEVRYGLERALARGATQKAERIRRWLAAAETIHRDRILPVTVAIAHEAGRMLNKAVLSGARPSSEDALIAATGLVHGLKVLSRNARDMDALEAHWSDPLALGLEGDP